MSEAEFQAGLLRVLGEIRDAVGALAAALTPAGAESDAPAPDTECVHPPDARIDFSGQGTSEWNCRDCGYQYRAVLGGD